MNKYIILISAILFFGSCKNEKQNSFNESINTALTAYETTPNKANASKVLDQLTAELKANKGNDAMIKEIAEKGLEIASETKMTSKEISYLLLLNKKYPKAPEAQGRLLSLANIMKSINKTQAANVLYSGVISRFPNTNDAEKANAAIAPTAKDVNAYLTKVGEDVFVDPDKYGVNRKAAQSYVDACEAYALAYAGTEKAPEYLYKGTEVSRTLRTFSKSLSMYDWIIDDYPNYEKAPTAMFLKGFIIENELDNDELAKEVYSSFLTKYPDHQLVDDVKFLLNNVGKTDEEIMQMIEDNKKKAN